MKKSKIASEPTPPEVAEAIQTIANYCKRGGWVEAIIYSEGGAAFNLSSVYDLILGECDGDGLEKLLTAESVE